MQKRNMAKVCAASIALLLTPACTDGVPVDSSVERTSSRLSAGGGAAVLGFETLADWTVVQGTVASFGLSDAHTEGASSLRLGARGFTAIRSRPIESLGVDAGANAYLDLMLPTAQASPEWIGAVQLYLEIPSQGLYNAYVGQVELTGMPLGVWRTIQFDIPAEIRSRLRAQDSDLTVTVVLNVPSDAPGDYLVDNLRFGLECPGGFVGPGERCPDPNAPPSPGPFGEFHCLLEEAGEANALTLPAGASSEALTLRGTMDFTMSPPLARLERAAIAGFVTKESAQGARPIVRDEATPGPGILDGTTGAVDVALPLTVYRDGEAQPLLLSFHGTLADHILTGQATAAPPPGASSPAAEVRIFCREQFMDAAVALHWKLDHSGAATLASATIRAETPGVPLVRQAQNSTDLLVEARSGTNNIVDQFVVARPLRQLDTSASSETGEVSDLYVSIPYSNRVQTIVLRDSSGAVLSRVDLSAQIASFCSNPGGQQCDYRAGTTVRQVVYAASESVPPLAFAAPAESVQQPIVPLPSSPRVTGGEFTVSDSTLDTQPTVAVDPEGNAVVVWRREFRDIMAKGISKDGTVQFDVHVNDVPCVTEEEYADRWTTRPIVTRAADGAFLVGWGAYYFIESEESKWLYGPFICARMFNADGVPMVEGPRLLAIKTTDMVLNRQIYFDLAMDDSHRFVLTWHGARPGADYYKVYARAFDATGWPLSDEPTVVSSDGTRDQMSPTVATDAAGRTVIAWLSASSSGAPADPPMPGTVRMRRFNSGLAPLGNVLNVPTLGSHTGVPDVALSRTGGSVVIAGSEAGGNIWAATYSFDTGRSTAGPFQANARLGGRQRSPVVNISETGEEFSIFWRDDVTVGDGTASVIAGQVFRSDTKALDVDFTVSTASAIDTENSPDDGLGFFSLSSASSTGSVVVWQTTGGISLQRVRGGEFSCPAPDTCSSIAPIRVAGALKDKFSLLFHPGVLEARDGTIISSSQDFKNEVDFSQAVARIVVNSLWQNDVLRSNTAKFNFFYTMEPGLRLIDDPTTFHAPDMPDIDFKSSLGRRAAGVVVPSGDGANYPAGNTSGRTFVTTLAGQWSSQKFATFAHEFSHAAFELSDEYDCSLGSVDTSYRELRPPIPPNAYTSAASCAARSAHPADCHSLLVCAQKGKTVYVADGRDLMGGSGTGVIQYGLDCERAAQYYLGLLR